MFKKTLVALALTGLAGVANAAKVDTSSTTTYSIEGIEQLASIDGIEAIAVSEVAATTNYQVGDEVTFTFPNDEFAIGTQAALEILDSASAAVKLKAGAPVYSGGNTVTFKLESGVGSEEVTKGAQFKLTGVNLDSKNLQAGGKVSVGFKAKSSVTSGEFDSSEAAVIADAKSQFLIEVPTPLNAIVDVTKGRLEFSGGELVDGLTLKSKTTAHDTPAVVNKVVYTLLSDFSFLDADGDGKVDADSFKITAGGATTNAIAYAPDLQSITVTETAGFSTDLALEITATDGDNTIPTQAYELKTDITYTPSKATATSVKSFKAKAGEWKLNGYEGTVSFLPFGGGASQIIAVANSGTLPGKITGELLVNGVAESIDLGVAAAKSVTNVGPALKDYARINGVVGNYAVKVIVEAPTKNITVEGVYFLNGDRVLVPTKSNKVD